MRELNVRILSIIISLSLAACDTVGPSAPPPSQQIAQPPEPTPTVSPLPAPRKKPKPTTKPVLRDLMLEVQANDPDSERDIFGNKVRPVLARNCLALDCHVAPEYIDLRSFPFAAEGSYTMDRIKAELGEDYVEHDAQMIVVDELIKSMEELYMPPAFEDVEPATDEEIGYFREWKDANLLIIPPTFSGTLRIIGKFEQAEVCQLSWPLAANFEQIKIKRKACPAMDSLTYSVYSESDELIISGEHKLTKDEPQKKLAITFER